MLVKSSPYGCDEGFGVFAVTHSVHGLVTQPPCAEAAGCKLARVGIRRWRYAPLGGRHSWRIVLLIGSVASGVMGGNRARRNYSFADEIINLD